MALAKTKAMAAGPDTAKRTFVSDHWERITRLTAPAACARKGRMAKSASFSCAACGNVTTKWAGRCEACGEWNSISEDAGISKGPAKSLRRQTWRGKSV